jgi:predicted AAA+ superfamily ATPase
MIFDELDGVKVILSGSSALELNQLINEPMTGRKWEYTLFPIAWMEYQSFTGYLQAKATLEQRLIYGMYPEVITSPNREKEVLSLLAGSYLYKDILEYGGIRKPELIIRILKALALQLGSEVSWQELAQAVESDKKTVQTYVDLLEKVFVIFKLEPLSKNMRNEISTSRKIYFYDNGIRNSILGNFQSFEFRSDKGALWENFLVSERLKLNSYSKSFRKSYFWRTYQQQEIDYIEEFDGIFNAYEFKWNPKKYGSFPSTFRDTYNPELLKTIHSDNFIEFVNPI